MPCFPNHSWVLVDDVSPLRFSKASTFLGIWSRRPLMYQLDYKVHLEEENTTPSIKVHRNKTWLFRVSTYTTYELRIKFLLAAMHLNPSYAYTAEQGLDVKGDSQQWQWYQAHWTFLHLNSLWIQLLILISLITTIQHVRIVGIKYAAVSAVAVPSVQSVHCTNSNISFYLIYIYIYIPESHRVHRLRPFP